MFCPIEFRVELKTTAYHKDYNQNGIINKSSVETNVIFACFFFPFPHLPLTLQGFFYSTSLL